jgi:hypothetical protein
MNVTLRNNPGLYRTLHPFPAMHDGMDWPSRGENYPVAPNNGSFDVYSRLFTLANANSDGGAIKVTAQQWYKIRQRNGFVKLKEDWLVGGTDKVMMWAEGSVVPVFHYPLCFGGNVVKKLEDYGKFARIATWPESKDVPDDLPPYYWHRCWCVYNAATEPIRDAPAGVGSLAVPVWMLVLAHSESAWIWNQGLMKL